MMDALITELIPCHTGLKDSTGGQAVLQRAGEQDAFSEELRTSQRFLNSEPTMGSKPVQATFHSPETY